MHSWSGVLLRGKSISKPQCRTQEPVNRLVIHEPRLSPPPCAVRPRVVRLAIPESQVQLFPIEPDCKIRSALGAEKGRLLTERRRELT